MKTDQILKDLDKHAAEFNFPMLDNAYIEFAVARLTAFRDFQDWLITFEVVGFSPREIQFVNDIYGYGSCNEIQGLIGQEIPVSSLPQEPLFDPDTNACLADWRHWSVNIGGETMAFSPTGEEYAEAGIPIDRGPGPGSLKEIELLRFLVYRLGPDRFFLSDQDLLRHCLPCRNLRKFVQTTQWQHPDLARQEKPSQNTAIRSLLEAMLQDDSSLFVRGSPNTGWYFWASDDH